MSQTGLSRCAELESCAMWRILDATRHVAAPLGLEEVLEKAIESALQVLDAERGTVFLYDQENNELYSRVSTGSRHQESAGSRKEDFADSHEIRFPADAGIAGETAQKRQLINVPDCYADARFNRDVDRRTGFTTRCMLSIPLLGIEGSLVGVLQVLNRRDGVFGTDDEQIAVTLAAQCAVVLQRSMLLEEYIVKQKFERDLAIAREIQMGVLPEELPRLSGYELSGWSKAADETGGDVYDAVRMDDNRVALLLGDATGHGIGPALSVSQVRAMFHMGLLLGADLDQIFSKINEQLTMDLPGERFVTGFIGILDNEKNRIHYHSGGQGPLLHYHADSDELEWVNASALPMGMFATLPLVEPAPIELAHGDIFALLTDGFFEYEDSAGEELGRDRVGQTIRNHRHLPPSELIELICDLVQKFAQGAPQQDDMTIVLIKRGVRP